MLLCDFGKSEGTLSEHQSYTLILTDLGSGRADTLVFYLKNTVDGEKNDCSDFILGLSLFTEDGRLKYKVCFEQKGRSLVSGHHIAFDTIPDLEQLYVGARVVVRFPDHKFRPGVLSELPSRKNRLRCVVLYPCPCLTTKPVPIITLSIHGHNLVLYFIIFFQLPILISGYS